MFQYVVDILSAILFLLLILCGSYYLSIAVFSFAPDKRMTEDNTLHKFAVLIPAHNEEAVLPYLIKSIRQAKYPQNLISVYVIADGCNDMTADIAVRMGASVIVRDVSIGKGSALAEGFSYICENNKAFDCVTVIDADNLVDEFYFMQMNERILLNEVAVQGYVDSKNPRASWVAGAHSVWYLITNRLTQTGRTNIGLGCRLNGTGFTLTRELIENIPWNTETEAEDAEYTAILAENGVKVDFAKNAVVYDEKPIDFSVSANQRRRWASGVFDVLKKHSLKLIKNGRLNALLGLWEDVLSPLVYTLILIMTVFKIGSIFDFGTAAINTALVYLIAFAMLSLFAIVKDGRRRIKAMPDMFGFLLYLISWVPIGIIGLFRRNKEWYHTKHKI